jgi:peptide/nickel transport system permease protein
MTAYGIRRMVQAIPTLLGATILGFALIHLAPGDPIQFYAAQSGGMTNEDIERLRHLYGARSATRVAVRQLAGSAHPP